jgi:hypothetical protein
MKKSRIHSLARFVVLAVSMLFAYHCSTQKRALNVSEKEQEAFKSTEKDTVVINSDKTEYEIIIIEPGFNVWLQSVARPPGYYSQNFLENRNWIWVTEWNNRVLQPSIYNPNLYELQIDYRKNIDYGYDLNYKLYNYFIYFQRRYNQRLGTFLPRL